MTAATYWDKRYAAGKGSGPASRGELAEYKASVVNRLIREHGIETVGDFGCGDGVVAALFTVPGIYIGFDIAPTAITAARRACEDQAGKSFMCAAPGPGQWPFDLTLSLDVLFHIVDDADFDRYLEALFTNAHRMVVIYSSDYDAPANGHMRRRQFTPVVAERFPAWRLTERIDNPHRGPDTEADFYVYERAAG